MLFVRNFPVGRYRRISITHRFSLIIVWYYNTRSRFSSRSFEPGVVAQTRVFCGVATDDKSRCGTRASRCFPRENRVRHAVASATCRKSRATDDVRTSYNDTFPRRGGRRWAGRTRRRYIYSRLKLTRDEFDDENFPRRRRRWWWKYDVNDEVTGPRMT